MNKPGVFCLLLLAALTFSCNSKTSESKDAVAVAVSENRENAVEIPGKERQPVKFKSAGSNPERTAATSHRTGKVKKHGKNRRAKNQLPQKTSSNSYAFDTAEPEPEKQLTVAEVYRHFDKKAQTFSILPNRDTTIICREGTLLKIPANAFVSEKNGLPVYGPVQIQVKEYYTLSDMLLANLSTKSGNANLETGGMVHLAASSGYGPCLLKPNQQIDIGIPFNTRQEAMQLFDGKWQENNLDWQLAQNPNEIDQVADSRDFEGPQPLKPDVFPTYRGGEKALKKHLAKYTRYPLTPLKAGTEGTVELKLKLARNGKVTEVLVLNGSDPWLNKAAVFAAEKMPNWKPARADKKPMASFATVSVPFCLDGIVLDRKTRAKARRFEKYLEEDWVRNGDFRDTGFYSTPARQFKKEFERKITDANLQGTSLKDIGRYLFSTSRLGWINCDRFMQIRGPKIDFVISHQGMGDVSVKVIFHSARSILPGFFRKGQYAVTNVPLGQKVTIVALKTEGDKVLLAVKKSTINRAGEANLTFEPVTMARLQAEMEKLNRLR